MCECTQPQRHHRQYANSICAEGVLCCMLRNALWIASNDARYVLVVTKANMNVCCWRWSIGSMRMCEVGAVRDFQERMRCAHLANLHLNLIAFLLFHWILARHWQIFDLQWNPLTATRCHRHRRHPSSPLWRMQNGNEKFTWCRCKGMPSCRCVIEHRFYVCRLRTKSIHPIYLLLSNWMDGYDGETIFFFVRIFSNGVRAMLRWIFSRNFLWTMRNCASHSAGERLKDLDDTIFDIVNAFVSSNPAHTYIALSMFRRTERR